MEGNPALVNNTVDIVFTFMIAKDVVTLGVWGVKAGWSALFNKGATALGKGATGFGETAAEKFLSGESKKIVNNVADKVKQWLGQDYRVINNKAGDDIFMSKDGLRKIRFDFQNTHGDKPHIHFEIFENGRWRNAVPDVHRIYLK